jgi:hypothetical protein
MSKWIIEDVRIYDEVGQELPVLSKGIEEINSEATGILNDLLRDLNVDYKETEEEIQQSGKEDDTNALEQRKFELKSLISEVEHMIIAHRQMEIESQRLNNKMQKAQEIMSQFSAIAERYLGSQSFGAYNTEGRGIDQTRMNTNVKDNYRHVGDAFHYTKTDALNQMDIAKLEQQIMQSSDKGSKISIDKVSQLDFDLLEKNGYTINNNGPNDFSAYKIINKQ